MVSAERTSNDYGNYANRAVLVCLFLLVHLSPAPATADVTAEQAREAIRRAVEALRASQNRAMGTWEDHGRFKGGGTTLCALALLNAGVPSDDPQIQAALRYLRKIGNPKSTYSTSLQTMVFCIAEPKRDWADIGRNVKWLQKQQVADGEGVGGWSYDDRMGGNPDNSNSQFALLALNEAQAIGVPVAPIVWKRSVTYWKTRQLKDGAWSYRGSNGKGSMTCAGISSLIIANRNLTQGDAMVLNGQVACCGMQRDDEELTKAFAWMGRNFSAKHNPSTQPGSQRTYLFYYLYGLERIGRLSGKRFIGEHDWYREGAEFLIADQNLKGEWKSSTSSFATHITTAMALLFLAKGQRPVVVSKLTHAPDDDWNHHRQDIGNLTHYIEQRWKKPMTWQVIDHRNAGVEDLLQSPVLYLSGRDSLQMDQAQKDSLREYVQQGGFVFAEACCNGKGFDRDFRALMTELFPNNPMRLLPADHPVWYAEQRVPATYLRPLYGIDSCCRTSVVYCPSNLGCFWELARGQGMQYPAKIQKEVDAMLAIGSNVIAYATNRRLRDKLDVPQTTVDDTDKSRILRGTLRVAKLQHGGGSDDAPAALANLLRAAGQHLQIRVDASRVLLPATESSLPDYPALFVHGRTNFVWSEIERKAIRDFITNGGVLFGDAICASKEFSQALEREVKLIYPEARWQRIPPTHPLFGDSFGGFDLSQVRLQRSPSQAGDGAMKSQVEKVTPLIEGIEVDGRFVVMFSPHDMSCALESNASSDCLGYVSEDAARLGVNILLYSLRQ